MSEEGEPTDRSRRKSRSRKRVLRLLVYYGAFLVVAAGGLAIGYVEGEKHGYDEAIRSNEIPICSEENAFLGTLPRASAWVLLGGDSYDHYLRRSSKAVQYQNLDIVSFGADPSRSFSFEHLHGDLDLRFARLRPVHHEALPQELAGATGAGNGLDSHLVSVFFAAPRAETRLNWQSFHEHFAGVKEALSYLNTPLERVEVSPSCLIARYGDEDGVHVVLAMHGLPEDRRDRAQCYWVSALAGYGVSGFRYLYENYPLREEADGYAPSITPIEWLYRLNPNSFPFETRFEIPAGARVCQDW